MITVNYLKELLTELEEFSDPSAVDNQIKSGDGFDEITAILESIRSIVFPCVVIEDKSSGNFTIEDGPVDTYTITLWIMLQQTREEENDNSEIFRTAFALMKKIVVLLIREQEKGTHSVASLDISRMPYNKRLGGPNCLGYELLLTFRENIELSYE